MWAHVQRGIWGMLLLAACSNTPLSSSLHTPPANHTPEILSLNLKPSSGVAPLAVSFNWLAQDADVSKLSCTVDFDSDAQNDQHFSNCASGTGSFTYQRPGRYTLKLRLEDSQGGVSETTRSVEVLPNSNPVIHAFTATPGSGQVRLPVTYSWSIEDLEADPLTCKLDINDNNSFEFVIPNCEPSSSRTFTFVDPGTYQARLRVEDSRGGFSERVLPSPIELQPDTYDIALRVNGNLSPNVQTAFDSARTFWSQIITKGLTYEANFSIPANSCIGQFPAFSGSIDDVLIDVRVAPIDGLGGVRGQAGVCWTHTDSYLPLYGVMEFDEADLEDMAKQGLLNRLILHEMGHVLGFGTLWDFKRSLVVGGSLGGPCGAAPVFVGANALREWKALGGSGKVPLENTGGLGTCNSHWQESTFSNELMTGYLNPGSNPVSRLTVASFEDLGYSVDYSAAESYLLPITANRTPLERLFPVKLVRPKGVWKP